MLVTEREPPTTEPVPEREIPVPFVGEEVDVVFRFPLFPYRRPVRVPRMGLLVNVCVPLQVFEVVVPNAREKLFAARTIG